jgi:DNA polymerase-3 subunit alpha
LSISRAISKANTHYYYEQPHITLSELADTIKKDSVFAITGWFGSDLSNLIFQDIKEVYFSKNYEEAKSKVNSNWLSDCSNLINKYKDIFGIDNFYLGIQLVDYSFIHGSKLSSDGIRYLSRKTNTKVVALPDSYYPNQDDVNDQRVLLVNKLNTNFKKIANRPIQIDEASLMRFFQSDNYHIPSYDEMIKYGHTINELSNTLEIANQCTKYKLTHPPMLPKFATPNGQTSAEYLKELCRIGWTKRWPQINKVIEQGKYTKEDYVNRFNTEFTVLNSAGLSDYFLIVNDIINYAISDGQLTGSGRGSAAGSLILYLLGITHVDPIEHGLLWERFYNEGRNTPGNVSLPDVDMDFEVKGRERILNYIRNKFGHDKVAQMITFNRMQGRGSLKDVIRAHDTLDQETSNRITENIPDESKIADQLELMKEADKESGGDGDASIIEWSLENNPDSFAEWVHYDDNGKLQGPLSKIFEQAIRMEGTKRASGKHAAGIVISQQTLSDICPMSYDSNTEEMITAIEMNGLADMGHVKFDILGINSLDKCHLVINYLRSGKLELPYGD